MNVGEVWYIMAREASQVEAEDGVAELRGLGVNFTNFFLQRTEPSSLPTAKY
ncbi:MAG: hypothetical protein HY314_09620 [Acidobacteria bacterium]|nr:hypothetical protein [Acidobacteriota bacterium]